MNTLTLDLIKTKNSDVDKSYLGQEKAIALGFFDGIHRGHQEIIRRMVEEAEIKGLESVLMSFDRFPKPLPANHKLNVIVPGLHEKNELLQSPLAPANYDFLGFIQSSEQRNAVLENMGVDSLYLQVFDEKNAAITPHEFAYGILTELLNCKVLYVGQDYRFAKGQEGNIEFLKQWAKDTGAVLRVVDPVYYEEELVSSTRIRNHIVEGEMEDVSRLMGRPYTIPGIVIKGQALGRTIGMPTANIRVPEGMVVPKYGVYNSVCKVGDTSYNAITSIGLRPTVNHTDPYPLVETTILNEDINLYGQYIEVELLKHERDEERFPSFISMSAEIDKDMRKAIKYHSSHENFQLFTNKNNIPIYVSKSDRFNTSYFSVEVYLPVDEDEVVANALLARILTATTTEYDTRPKLAAYLQSQYASEITVKNEIIGDLQRITFTLSSINRSLDETGAFKNSSNLFINMLIDPVWNEFYNFADEIVSSEKMNMIFELNQSRFSSKKKALSRAITYLDKSHSYTSVDNLPIEVLSDMINDVSALDLQRAWMNLFNNGHIRVFLSGRFEDNSFAKELSRQFSRIHRSNDSFNLLPGKGLRVRDYQAIEKHTEYTDSKLANVVLIFNNLPSSISIRELDAQIFSAMLAGRSTSLLNRAIRTELGYSYGVSSEYNPFTGLLNISAEVEPEDRDRVVEIAQSVINDIKNNNFAESDFLSAFRFIENNLAGINDVAARRLEYASVQKISGSKYTVLEALVYAQSVDKEDMQVLAGELNLLLDFALMPNEYDTDEEIFEEPELYASEEDILTEDEEDESIDYSILGAKSDEEDQ